MITVQPIRFTARPSAWHRLAEVLRLVPAFPPQPEWSEFDGDGILAIHHAGAGSADAGRTAVHLLSDDLDNIEFTLVTAGFEVERTVPEDIGPLLTVTASTGQTITVSGGARRAAGAALAMLPLWYADDLTEPRAILEVIGLRPRIASDAGTWIDFTADGGGLVALHHGTGGRVELSLEYRGDLDTLAERLTAAGFDASVTDEAYNRTLRSITPDGDELWINQVMDDLYGYTRIG